MSLYCCIASTILSSAYSPTPAKIGLLPTAFSTDFLKEFVAILAPSFVPLFVNNDFQTLPLTPSINLPTITSEIPQVEVKPEVVETAPIEPIKEAESVETAPELTPQQKIEQAKQARLEAKAKIDAKRNASKEEVVVEVIDDRKKKQLEIINKSNPAPNNYNTWVRSVDDIKEAKDVFETAFNEGEMYPDFTVDNMREALDYGEVTIYSSQPIKNGVFITPSKMNAEEYAGGKGGKIYSKKININDVAWIDESEGQYAPIKETPKIEQPKVEAAIVDGKPKTKVEGNIKETSENIDITKDYSLKEIAKTLVNSKTIETDLSKISTQEKIDLYQEIKKQRNGDKMSKEWSNILEEETNHPSAQFILNSIYYNLDSKTQKILNKQETSTKVETAKSKVSEASKVRKEAKAKLDAKKRNLGIANDPKQDAQDLYDYHQALVSEAKAYIEYGVASLEEFAEALGEKVTKSIKQAWEEAKGISPKITKVEDLSYDFNSIDEEVVESKKEHETKQKGPKKESVKETTQLRIPRISKRISSI